MNPATRMILTHVQELVRGIVLVHVQVAVMEVRAIVVVDLVLTAAPVVAQEDVLVAVLVNVVVVVVAHANQAVMITALLIVNEFVHHVTEVVRMLWLGQFRASNKLFN